jgi:hypothetical protein
MEQVSHFDFTPSMGAQLNFGDRNCETNTISYVEASYIFIQCPLGHCDVHSVPKMLSLDPIMTSADRGRRRYSNGSMSRSTLA